MSVAVDFKNVDIVFGPDTREALAMMDRGATRAEILEKTGNVLGCAGAVAGSVGLDRLEARSGGSDGDETTAG